ncbi:hypothetical protein F5Y10DRAFT_257365 [Nemania abortiva]|nr:hypothetical protein F5Y10DRAFT_257365 [Nemania abortiva]
MTTTPLDITAFFNVIDGDVSDTRETTKQAINPVTLEPNPEAPLSTQQDVNRAVEIARNAAPRWSAVAWAERANTMRRFADACQVTI